MTMWGGCKAFLKFNKAFYPTVTAPFTPKADEKLGHHLYYDASYGQNIALFFLGCVAVAGIVGAVSAEKKILFVQTVPAVIAIALLLVV